jgi:hypothetical protein
MIVYNAPPLLPQLKNRAPGSCDLGAHDGNRSKEKVDHVYPSYQAALKHAPASMGASHGNWFPSASASEQAEVRVGTPRASSQSLAEQFAGSIVGEILYARLFCGLRFFDKNHKMTREFPPCAVKQVCSIIATAKSQGRTTEEPLPEEIKLAANGLEKFLHAAPHALCFTCANRFCPIKKKIAGCRSTWPGEPTNQNSERWGL